MDNYELNYVEYKKMMYENILYSPIKDFYNISNSAFEAYFNLIFYNKRKNLKIDIHNFENLLDYYLDLLAFVENNAIVTILIKRRKVEIMLRDFFDEYEKIKAFVKYEELFHILFLYKLDNMIFDN